MDRPTASSDLRPRPKRRLLFPLIAFVLATPALGALLSFVSVVRDGVGGVEGLRGVKGIALSSDGMQLYTAGNDDNSLAVFDVHEASGLPIFREVHEDGEDGVFGLLGICGVAASPDLRNVYATSEFDDSLVVFSRDASTDSLHFLPEHVQEDRVGGIFGLDGACSLTVTPDNSQVFVVARSDDALTVFSRDATTDALTLADVEFEGLAPLRGASDVAVSPDSLHVYVSAESDDSVSMFQRNLATGQVAFLGAFEDGVGGVFGLNGASSVTVSPDGKNVYATGRVDHSVVMFARDGVTGTLSFLGALQDATLRGPTDVAVHPSGYWVLTTSRDDNAVAMYRRDLDTGVLTLEGVVRDGENGVSGLDGAIAAVMSFDHVFVAGYKADSIAIFDIPTEALPLLVDGFESGNLSAWSSFVP